MSRYIACIVCMSHREERESVLIEIGFVFELLCAQLHIKQYSRICARMNWAQFKCLKARLTVWFSLLFLCRQYANTDKLFMQICSIQMCTKCKRNFQFTNLPLFCIEDCWSPNLALQINNRIWTLFVKPETKQNKKFNH